MTDINALDLEEAAGAMCVPHDGKHREWAVAAGLRVAGDEIPRHPAQERGDVVGEERSDDERADLPVGRRLSAAGVDDFDIEQIGPKAEAADLLVLSSHHPGFCHPERVAQPCTPHALDLLAFRLRDRLCRADHQLDRAAGKLVSVLISEIGEVQRVAGHSHPHAGPDFVDELKLKRGRRCRARARHEHRQPALLRRAGHHLACRMDAERKRAVHPLRSFDASAMEDAAEAQHCGREVAMAARVEQRPSGRASGAPILGDAVAIGFEQAEIPIELGIRHAAQHVLVEDRNLIPLGRIIEPVDVHVIELALEKRSPPRLRHRIALALRLNLADVVSGRRRGEGRQDGAHGVPCFNPVKVPIQRSCRL